MREDYQTLLFDQAGVVTRITLNRPEAANGMDDTMTRELADAATRCAGPGTKVVLLTGAGRFFCAGGDLRAMARAESAGRFVQGIADDLHQAVSTFARMDAVLIVAVNGTAAGAGFSLVAGADLVVAADTASFTMAYTRAGLSPDGGASYYLPRVLGARRTAELMLTNRTLTAAEAADWGLVNEVVAAEELTGRANELASQIAAGSGAAQAAVKKLLLASFGNALEAQTDMEGRLIAANADGPGGHEGIAAFLEKRKPAFG